MSLTLSFISGIIAAFTPCVIVLIPLLLYRFFHEKEKHFTLFIFFTSGFLVTYLIFAYFLSELFTSAIQNGIKFSLGLLFIILGVLAIMNKFNPMNIQLVKNPFLLGSIFASIISFNPCTLPYFSFILTLSNQSEIILNILAFALGLLVPSILFAFLGNSLISFTQKSGNIFNKLKHLMNVILILSGVYLIYTIKTFSYYDSFIISGVILLIFYILFKAFFIIYSYKDLFKLENIFSILALLLLFFSISFHCSTSIDRELNNPFEDFLNLEQTAVQSSCSGNVTDCEVCMRCFYLFISSFILAMIVFTLRYKKRIFEK